MRSFIGKHWYIPNYASWPRINYRHVTMPPELDLEFCSLWKWCAYCWPWSKLKVYLLLRDWKQLPFCMERMLIDINCIRDHSNIQKQATKKPCEYTKKHTFLSPTKIRHESEKGNVNILKWIMCVKFWPVLVQSVFSPLITFIRIWMSRSFICTMNSSRNTSTDQRWPLFIG